MSSFLQEVWHDLREKRMWPVAALLTLAVLTVPFVLKKSPSDSSSAATPPVASQQKSELPAVLPDGGTVTGSALSVFTGGDPFKPKMKVKDNTLASTPAPASGLGGAGAAGGTGGAGAGSTGGSSGGGTTVSPPGTIKKAAFAYVLDLHFGLKGHEKSIKGLEKLQMLPSSDSPLLVFLGATSGGDDAVFLLDSTLKQAGEGHCADSACSLLSIGPGSEHHFVDPSGKEYVLQIDQIRRVKLGAHSARASAHTSVAHTARNAVGQTVHTAVVQTTAAGQAVQKARAQSEQRARAFVSALLVDVETAANTDAGP